MRPAIRRLLGEDESNLFHAYTGQRVIDMKGYRWHVLFYELMRPLVGPPIKLLLKYKPTPIPLIEGPCLVVANHNTDFDAILLGLAFPKHMYYVASEHIFRTRLIRALLSLFLGPIPKRKGGTDVRTAMQMARRFRAGQSIGLFAEGNKSFHGSTCPIHPATGSMVKASGATLVTYRLEGGYFTSPRWGHTLRRGGMRGVPIQTYPPSELAAMTPHAINEIIARDIFEDAYANQREHPIRYRGKRLAEGIENALYACPRCHAFGTVRGKGDRVLCTCGLEARYTETGMLTGTDIPFSSLQDWGDWQKTFIQACVREKTEAPLFSDADQTIVRIHADHRTNDVAHGTLFFGRGGLTCGALHLPLSDISGLEIYGRNTIVFSDGAGNRYQVISPAERSGLKYFDAYEIMRQGGD